MFPINRIRTNRPSPNRRTGIVNSVRRATGAFVNKITDVTGLNTIIGLGMVNPSKNVESMLNPVRSISPIANVNAAKEQEKDEDQRRKQFEAPEGFEDETFPHNFYSITKRKKFYSMRSRPRY